MGKLEPRATASVAPYDAAASRSRSGVMGRSRMRRPVAANTALASAPGGWANRGFSRTQGIEFGVVEQHGLDLGDLAEPQDRVARPIPAGNGTAGVERYRFLQAPHDSAWDGPAFQFDRSELLHSMSNGVGGTANEPHHDTGRFCLRTCRRGRGESPCRDRSPAVSGMRRSPSSMPPTGAM